MQSRAINPISTNSFASAFEVKGAQRLLFISGQVPEDAELKVPETFREQARLTWRNVEAQLHAADMTLDNVVKVTTFLSHRRYRTENYEVRHAVLGARTPAVTIIVCDIYDEAWLLEIEVIAAA